ncbi:polysaccharide deacetylase [Geothermobacter ehrlichii]|uniref:Polysaccharide deacetylase n=1 Tax=Geothermobacter ehrlichii TaxID=213224 RepID=A0A5D3WRL3_9BACT|nr:polysaccharide deacetylase family protein [Geothermobacter ehrlichii]TYP00239.1 polysaccharide deacetylase [Geothermobacter ehrlichii]
MKTAILFLLFLCVSVGQVVAAGRANLFIYHRFGERRYPSTNVSLEDFRAHLAILKKSGVAVVSLGELVDRLEGKAAFDRPLAVLTVDDGFRSFLRVLPLLEEYGFPVTLFINTDAVGGASYLGWDEIRELMTRGVEIGSHSAAHLHMVDRKAGETEQQRLQRLRDDLEQARTAFRRHLGIDPDLFAYPYGEYDPAVEQLLKRMGFRAAVAQQSGVVTTASDRYALPRFPMGGPYADPKQFAGKLAMRRLPVFAVRPLSPVLAAENPPVLTLGIAPGQVDLDRLTCYVSGQPGARIEWIDKNRGLLRVRAAGPISGRRGKYTLTAPGLGGGWHWYSHLWIRPDVPERGY